MINVLAKQNEADQVPCWK